VEIITERALETGALVQVDSNIAYGVIQPTMEVYQWTGVDPSRFAAVQAAALVYAGTLSPGLIHRNHTVARNEIGVATVTATAWDRDGSINTTLWSPRSNIESRQIQFRNNNGAAERRTIDSKYNISYWITEEAAYGAIDGGMNGSDVTRVDQRGVWRSLRVTEMTLSAWVADSSGTLTDI
jgi:hypothetical protein